MPDEGGTFQTIGMSWGERAQLGGLNSVLSPLGSNRRNTFIHSVHTFGARVALALNLHHAKGILLDFGCGTGRFTRFFDRKGYSVIGTEITWGMLEQARSTGISQRSSMILTDGIILPLRDRSVDMIWCCGVLRYSLFVAKPAYNDISREMYRVLKPGGLVVNLEMYVDKRPEEFTSGFELAGFTTKRVRILQRYGGRIENHFQASRVPLRLVAVAGHICALIRMMIDNPASPHNGLVDYLFVWSKPSIEND